jgi:hypothetical protein
MGVPSESTTDAALLLNFGLGLGAISLNLGAV